MITYIIGFSLLIILGLILRQVDKATGIISEIRDVLQSGLR